MSNRYRIDEHWDTSGIITADADPVEEYNRWKAYAADNHADWGGYEFKLADFEQYIASLSRPA